jgi:hypothetical protein
MAGDPDHPPSVRASSRHEVESRVSAAFVRVTYYVSVTRCVDAVRQGAVLGRTPYILDFRLLFGGGPDYINSMSLHWPHLRVWL